MDTGKSNKAFFSKKTQILLVLTFLSNLICCYLRFPTSEASRAINREGSLKNIREGNIPSPCVWNRK
jgi:hypothetical protein